MTSYLPSFARQSACREQHAQLHRAWGPWGCPTRWIRRKCPLSEPPKQVFVSFEELWKRNQWRRLMQQRAGCLGCIWETSDWHLGGIGEASWSDLSERHLGGISQASGSIRETFGKHLGGIWWEVGARSAWQEGNQSKSTSHPKSKTQTCLERMVLAWWENRSRTPHEYFVTN